MKYVYYCPYFIVDKPEDLSSLVTCLQSHSREEAEAEYEPRQSSCRTCTLNHSAILHTMFSVTWD